MNHFTRQGGRKMGMQMNIDNFTNRAQAYAKGRPGYTIDCIEKICEIVPDGAVVADIGAGTGKLTQELAKQGYTINAVEPNKDMQRQLHLTVDMFTNVKIVNGTAENTTLPDHCFDAITVAHALHWFDLECFKKECRRILKPHGIIIAIYNHVPGMETSDFCIQTIHEFFSAPMTWTCYNPINYTREEWIAYILSQDDSILPGEDGYEAYIESLHQTFDKQSMNGLMCCDRVTGIYWGSVDQL